MSFIDKFLDAIKLNDDFDDDDGDEDYIDDEEEEEEEAEERHSRKKPEPEPKHTEKKERKRFFNRFSSSRNNNDDDDDFDDDYDDEEAPARARRGSREPVSDESTEEEKISSYSSSYSARSSYSAPTRSRGARAEKNGRSEQSNTASSRTVRDWERTGTGSLRAKKAPKPSSGKKKDLADNPMEVNVIRPSSMEDTSEIADTLMNNCTVVLNLEGLDVDIAQRVIDFTCGVCYSLNGNLQKISSYIFIITPADVDISGDFQSILNGAFDIPSMNSVY